MFGSRKVLRKEKKNAKENDCIMFGYHIENSNKKTKYN